MSVQSLKSIAEVVKEADEVLLDVAEERKRLKAMGCPVSETSGGILALACIARARLAVELQGNVAEIAKQLSAKHGVDVVPFADGTGFLVGGYKIVNMALDRSGEHTKAPGMFADPYPLQHALEELVQAGWDLRLTTDTYIRDCGGIDHLKVVRASNFSYCARCGVVTEYRR